MAAASKSNRRNIRTANHAHLEEIREQAVSIGDSVRAMAASATAAAGDRLGPVEEYVRQKPLKSLMMAAGVGAVLGLFFFRRG